MPIQIILVALDEYLKGNNFDLNWGRFINDRIASFATLKSLIARVAANAVSSNCDRYFRFAKIANRYLEVVLAFHQKSQMFIFLDNAPEHLMTCFYCQMLLFSNTYTTLFQILLHFMSVIGFAENSAS